MNKVAGYEFGKRLNYIRHRKGISMDEVALAIGSTKSTLSRYERGLMDPTLESAQKLANYFMVTVDWLAGYGDIEEGSLKIPQVYIAVIEKAIAKGVTSDQLSGFIDLITKG